MFSFRTTPLSDQADRTLHYGAVGCFCNQNCWDTATGEYMYEIFRRRGNLARLFMPRDTELTPGTNHIEFGRDQLSGLDAVVVEIQDVGSRYFNYARDVLRLMGELNSLGEGAPALYVVDHINPAGRWVEGSMPQGECEDYVPKVAHRHGLTLGELCNLHYHEIGAKFPFHVISALASDSTRQLLPWAIAPASDIPGMFTCYMYSGGALWNNTTMTPAIGTARPYEYIGAPFVKPQPSGVPHGLPAPEGVLMRPCSFTPAAGKYAGEKCYGYQIMLRPGAEYHSLLHTIRLVKYFLEHYSSFELFPEFFRKLADPVLADYLADKVSFQEAKEHVKVEEQKWIRKAKRFSLYDDAPMRMK